MKDKKTSETIESGVDMAQRLMMANTYQDIKKQMGTVSPRNVRKNAGITAVKNFEFGLRQPSRETLRNRENKTSIGGMKADLNHFIQDARRNRNGSNNIVGPKTTVRVPK